jgi:hypothetical protein
MKLKIMSVRDILYEQRKIDHKDDSLPGLL